MKIFSQGKRETDFCTLLCLQTCAAGHVGTHLSLGAHKDLAWAVDVSSSVLVAQSRGAQVVTSAVLCEGFLSVQSARNLLSRSPVAAGTALMSL